MKRKVFLILLGLLGTGPAVADDMERNLTPPQLNVLHTEPEPAKTFKVTAWVDHDDNTYMVGDTVTITVQPNAAAHVLVVDVGPTGETAVLYPNAVQADRLIGAGQTLKISGITATAPAGVELIRVIASTTPIDLVEVSGSGTFRSVVGGGDALVRNLVVAATKRQFAYYHKTIRTVE